MVMEDKKLSIVAMAPFSMNILEPVTTLKQFIAKEERVTSHQKNNTNLIYLTNNQKSIMRVNPTTGLRRSTI